MVVLCRPRGSTLFPYTTLFRSVPRSTARPAPRRAARQSASKSHGGSSATRRPSSTEKSQPRICAPAWARRSRSRRSSPDPVTTCPQSSPVPALSRIAGRPLGPRCTITAQIHLHHVVVHAPLGTHELVLLVQDREHVHREIG